MHTAYLSKELYKKDKDAGQTIRITNNSSFCQISFASMESTEYG